MGMRCVNGGGSILEFWTCGQRIPKVVEMHFVENIAAKIGFSRF